MQELLADASQQVVQIQPGKAKRQSINNALLYVAESSQLADQHCPTALLFLESLCRALLTQWEGITLFMT